MILYSFTQDYEITISTRWGQDKIATILHTTFSNQFSCVEIVVLWYKFHWNLFPNDPIDTKQWFRQRLGTKQATSHNQNDWWPCLMLHIWIKSMRQVVIIIHEWIWQYSHYNTIFFFFFFVGKEIKIWAPSIQMRNIYLTKRVDLVKLPSRHSLVSF